MTKTLILGILFFSFAGGYPAYAASPRTIRIGFIGPLTGNAAILAKDAHRAAQMVFGEANNSLATVRFELVAEDDKYQTSNTVTAFEKLAIQDEIRTIFVYTYSGLFAIAKRAKQNGVLLIDPLDCDESIAALEGNIFCIAKRTEDFGLALAEHALKNNLTPSALLYFGADAFPVTVAETVSKRLSHGNVPPVYQEGYSEGTTDFRSMITRAKARNPKSLFLFSYLEGASAIKQARQLGFSGKIYTLSNLVTKEALDIIGDSASNIHYARWQAPHTAHYKSFLSEFKKKVGRAPHLDISTVTTYDAAKLVVEALKEPANSNENPEKKLASFLYSTKDYPGASGSITIDSDGALRSFAIETLEFKSSNETY